MANTHSFSIYLLKPDCTPTNSLREDTRLEQCDFATDLPEGSTLYVLDGSPQRPWWAAYFGVSRSLLQVNKGALLFLPVGNRFFALSFGHVAHNLLETAYEYDFGLQVTLNSVDPRKLKSTDVVEPGASRRQRTQLPVESEITLFDFDGNSAILSSLTGKVREEHSDLFRHATGKSNLRISTDMHPDELSDLCERLLKLYSSDEYKSAFPEISNITPVRDPERVQLLDSKLLQAFHNRHDDMNLIVPDIVNFADGVRVGFSGAGKSKVYDDVFIGYYLEYLSDRGIALESIQITELQRHALALLNEDEKCITRFNIYRSLVFDVDLTGDTGTYHLTDGKWYRFDSGFVEKLSEYLDQNFVSNELPDFAHSCEGDYNRFVASAPEHLCLDTTNISPTRQKNVEPCDLVSLQDNEARFYHVKVSTLSASLSHLFNQGLNAIQLIREERVALDRLCTLINDSGKGELAQELTRRIAAHDYRVTFGIVTRKREEAKSLNLPLFSRISLMRTLKVFRTMNVRADYTFIPDRRPPASGRKKKTNRRMGADSGE